MKKIVLSGAGGFLGTNIIESCLKTGLYEIYAFSSKAERLNDLYGQNQGFHAINRQDVGG